jgi:hypothetical protein
MEAARSTANLAPVYQTTWRHIPFNIGPVRTFKILFLHCLSVKESSRLTFFKEISTFCHKHASEGYSTLCVLERCTPLVTVLQLIQHGPLSSSLRFWRGNELSQRRQRLSLQPDDLSHCTTCLQPVGPSIRLIDTPVTKLQVSAF